MVSKRNLRRPSERKPPDRYSPEPAAIQKRINAAHRAGQKRAKKQAAEVKPTGCKKTPTIPPDSSASPVETSTKVKNKPDYKAIQARVLAKTRTRNGGIQLSKRRKETSSISTGSSNSSVETTTSPNNKPDHKRTQSGRVTKMLPRKSGIKASKAKPKTQPKDKAKPDNKNQAAKPPSKKPAPAGNATPKKQAPGAKPAPKKRTVAAKPVSKPKASTKAAGASKLDINNTKGSRVTKAKTPSPKPTAKPKARTVSSTSNDSDAPLAKAIKRENVNRQSTPKVPSSGAARSASADDSPSASAAARRGLAVGQSVARSVVQGGQAVIGAAVEAAAAVVPSASPKVGKEGVAPAEKRWFDVGARRASESPSDSS